MENSERLYYLWQQFSESRISAEELEELKTYLDDPEKEEASRQYLVGQLQHTPFIKGYSEKRLQHLLQSIREKPASLPAAHGVFRFRKFWWAAAAVFLLIAGMGGYRLFFSGAPSRSVNRMPLSRQDIPPGGNKAILTLSNGSRIVLDSARDGELASQGNNKIVKLNRGVLAYRGQPAGAVKYSPGESLSAGAPVIRYNTLTTPRGGQYQLILPDGSRVWLNAASSITFPTAFTGKEREVQMTGEAYFEVAPDAAMPFTVKKGDVEVAVLGTHFNINGYDDEAAIKVTLLNGLVKVTQGATHHSLIIHPGQQAQLDKEGQIRLVDDIDVNEAVAWKNGKFQFDEAGIGVVMRQIARWYDVDVEYRGSITQHFGGSIRRSADASEVFKMLELTGGVHFQVEGKKVIVMP